MAQQRDGVIFHESAAGHLKLVGKLYDQVSITVFTPLVTDTTWCNIHQHPSVLKISMTNVKQFKTNSLVFVRIMTKNQIRYTEQRTTTKLHVLDLGPAHTELLLHSFVKIIIIVSLNTCMLSVVN